ncbi:hypothetical protein IGI04_042353 [Brassica rapa subsp. trilocularis]|uniref:Uncharacterized protein n=1 Tax=Brassica rapa subsp. trilocularis TaxID=1813537 RepID=A0ABQ7KJK1_BRACM|nr:hypothetical protein IGI04_042353 [Brassica rapa subsp. trilocularis]
MECLWKLQLSLQSPHTKGRLDRVVFIFSQPRVLLRLHTSGASPLLSQLSIAPHNGQSLPLSTRMDGEPRTPLVNLKHHSNSSKDKTQVHWIQLIIFSNHTLSTGFSINTHHTNQAITQHKLIIKKVLRIAYTRNQVGSLSLQRQSGHDMVGFKSLGRHPTPSPSVHGLLLVSHTQRPLLSSYFKPASLSFIFLVSGCDKLLDKELWLEVHDASPSSSASKETLSISSAQVLMNLALIPYEI